MKHFPLRDAKACAGQTSPGRDVVTRRQALWTGTSLVALPWALAGCGGVGEEGTGAAPVPTQGYTAGAITGFGSIIVNDIVFDESTATVEDGDGNAGSSSQLRLGMVVEVDSDVPASGTSGTRARASRVRYDAALVGPVTAVDAVQRRFTVLGQVVQVSDTTHFGTSLSDGLADVAVGRLVAVHAVPEPIGGSAINLYRATRVDRLSTALVHRLRGQVAQWDAATSVLRIGALQISAIGALGLPANLAVGQWLRLILRTTPDASGRAVALSFGLGVRDVGDDVSVSIKGHITRITTGNVFEVDGRSVNAAAAQVLPAGSLLAIGQRVEVRGTWRNGALQASSVEQRSDSDESSRGSELRGQIESVNLAAQRIVVRGVTVSLVRADLRYDNGSAANLVVGREVEVRGLPGPGEVLVASRIKFV